MLERRMRGLGRRDKSITRGNSLKIQTKQMNNQQSLTSSSLHLQEAQGNTVNPRKLPSEKKPSLG